jgi:hypothetical protein
VDHRRRGEFRPHDWLAMDQKCDAHITTTETLSWPWTKTMAPGAQFGRGGERGVRR